MSEVVFEHIRKVYSQFLLQMHRILIQGYGLKLLMSKV